MLVVALWWIGKAFLCNGSNVTWTTFFEFQYTSSPILISTLLKVRCLSPPNWHEYKIFQQSEKVFSPEFESRTFSLNCYRATYWATGADNWLTYFTMFTLCSSSIEYIAGNWTPLTMKSLCETNSWQIAVTITMLAQFFREKKGSDQFIILHRSCPLELSSLEASVLLLRFWL